MNLTKFQQTGWVLAAALVGIAAASGFQGNGTKIAIVDLRDAVNKSEWGKDSQKKLNDLMANRDEFLAYISQYNVVNVEQADTLHDLTVKPTLTAEEAKKLEDVKKAIKESTQTARDLQDKSKTTAPLTPAEKDRLAGYASMAQNFRNTQERWVDEFRGEVQKAVDERNNEGVRRAREALKEVASAGGYTVVFENDIAPYAPNDLTAATLTALNAKK